MKSLDIRSAKDIITINLISECILRKLLYFTFEIALIFSMS